MAKKTSTKVYRDSKTGKFVTKNYAVKHPKSATSSMESKTKGKNTGGTIGGGAKRK